ncbi:MAG: hypothetical protein LHW57_02195 [Candidatus Cloacimonetes bacterium]|nr:hypothetical protein [Candidatus Cloacimonadota bacterium]
MQTVKFFVLLALLGSIGILGADVFYSTAAGGNWNNVGTWVGNVASTPGAEDDVFIYGPVYVPAWTTVACHNLTVDGSAALLRNATDAPGTVNIGGDLALLNDGGIVSTLSTLNYYITLNLDGDFSQAGLCQPGIFKFSGSQDRHLSQSPGYSLAPYQFVDVTAGITLHIDTDFAASSSHASNLVGWRSTASTNYNLSLAGSADLALTNVDLLRANLSSEGTRALIWENTRNGRIDNCTLEDIHVQSTGITQLGYGVVLRDVVNQATLCNFATSGGITLNLEGDFDNFGELKSYPEAFYGLAVTSSGNIYNHGFFQPISLTLDGTGERYLSSSAEHPFMTTASITVNTSVGTIHAASDLHFYNCVQLYGGTFSLSDGTREDFDLYLTGCRTNNSTFLGGSASILQASAIRGVGTTIQSFALYGDISFASGCTLTDVVNHGILQNDSGSGAANVLINGNFPNYGTLRDHPDNNTLIVNVSGDLQNHGTWTAQTTNLVSTSSAQSIMFPQAHPCQSVSFNDTNSASAVRAVGDIWFQNCSLDFNSCDLVLDTAPSGLYITAGNLREVNIQSVAENVIDMSGGTLSSVTFQSITNAGTLSYNGAGTIYGDLVNNGYIQNHTTPSSCILTVQGSITNNGWIRDNPSGNAFVVKCWGNIVKSGIISCSQMYINGTANQTVNRGGSLAPAVFYLVSELGYSQWFLNGLPSGYTNTQISIPITNNDVLGTWQPYYPNTDTWGRTITIQAAGLPAIPQNVWMETIQPGEALLHWNEAANASSYGIYVSDDPYGGFTLLWDNIIDPNPGDGTVEFTISTTDARKFFRIVARN